MEVEVENLNFLVYFSSYKFYVYLSYNFILVNSGWVTNFTLRHVIDFHNLGKHQEFFTVINIEYYVIKSGSEPIYSIVIFSPAYGNCICALFREEIFVHSYIRCITMSTVTSIRRLLYSNALKE